MDFGLTKAQAALPFASAALGAAVAAWLCGIVLGRVPGPITVTETHVVLARDHGEAVIPLGEIREVRLVD